MFTIGAGCRRILLLVTYDRYFCDPNLYSGRKFWIIPFKSSTIFGVVTKNYINNWEANLFVLFNFILQETLPGKDEEEGEDGEEEGEEGGEEDGEGGEEGPDWDRAEFLSSQGCDLMYFFHPSFLQNYWKMGRSDNDSEDGHRKSKKKKSKRYEEITVPDSVCSVKSGRNQPIFG